ncbi:MAG: hypothetical protein AAGI38_03705 [Bacteroidota bacterium]
MRYLFICLFFIPGLLSAQDLMIRNDRSGIQVKVIEITADEIVYQLFQESDSTFEASTQRIAKTEVEAIIYQSGMKQYFSKASSDPNEPLPTSPIDSSTDIIVMRDGSTRYGTISSIEDNMIIYTRKDDPAKREVRLRTKMVKMVVYRSGMKQYFDEPRKPKAVTQEDAREMYQKGRDDARAYYRPNGPLWGTLIPSCLCGLPGTVVSGVAVCVTPPRLTNKDVPNPGLFERSTAYENGYRKQAHNIKVGQAAKGAGIGTGISLLAYLVWFIAVGG